MIGFLIVFIGVLAIIPLSWVLMPKPSSRHARHKRVTQ